jgi:hypothetical protein
VYRKRGMPFPFFEVFDLPDQTITCGRRNVSTVPTQALTLMNNEFILAQAKRFGERIRQISPSDAGEQLRAAYEIAIGRAPTPEERRVGEEFLKQHSIEDFAHVMLNLNEFLYIR